MALIFYFLHIFIIAKINAWKYNLCSFKSIRFLPYLIRGFTIIYLMFLICSWQEQQQSWIKSSQSGWDSMAACHIPERDSFSSLQIFFRIESIKRSLSGQSCVIFVRWVAYFTYEQQKCHYHELWWFFDVFSVDNEQKNAYKWNKKSCNCGTYLKLHCNLL